jgi:hypothetical protein
MDVWYNANLANGTLPEEYKEYTLEQILDDLGVGHHRMYEFIEVEPIDRCLGFYLLDGTPYEIELQNVDREFKKEGDTTYVTYHTPVGSVSCSFIFTEEMRSGGMTICITKEHLIKDFNDFKPVGYIFRNLKITPNYDKYLKWYKSMGNKGLANLHATDYFGPMDHILHELMDVTKFYYAMYDNPIELKQLCEDMEPYFEKIYEIAANSPSEARVVYGGSNMDDTITYTSFFEKYMMPYSQKLSEMLHEKGKLLLSHCDGENKKLLPYLAESGIDIAEAVAPQPLTKCTIKEIRDAFKDKITVFGGVASTVLLEDSVSDEKFEEYMKNLFNDIAPGNNFILGVSDTTPPDAKLSRIKRITEMVEDLGEVPF